MILIRFIGLLLPLHLFSQRIFISEFHYDDASRDTTEFVEITAPADNNLSCYYLFYVNGGGTSPIIYKVLPLKGEAPNQNKGMGVVLLDNGKSDQIQNGAKDGFLLYDSCGKKALQYISYEGELPALKPYTLTGSKDIKVFESSEPDSVSVYVTGEALTASAMIWVKGKKTAGHLNTALRIGADATYVVRGKILSQQTGCSVFKDMSMSVTLHHIGVDAHTDDDVYFSVPVQEDGSYEIQHIAAGHYTLHINTPLGYRLVAPQPIEVKDGAVELPDLCVEKVLTSDNAGLLKAISIHHTMGWLQILAETPCTILHYTICQAGLSGTKRLSFIAP